MAKLISNVTNKSSDGLSKELPRMIMDTRVKKISSFRLRKCSDINLDLPFCEVIDETNEIVMDISESDDGERSILFNPACVGKTMSIELILRIIQESSDLINNEKN